MSIPLPSSAAPTHQQVGNPNVMGLWLPATDDLKLAVVIATHNRPSLLKERALASVAAQSRRPDLLIIVDDSEASVRPRNRGSVESVDLPECRVLYCENDRTPGASGAWNTALDRLAEQGLDPHDVFVAVLDDDDAWAPAYLETCYATILTNPLDMVAADLRRIEAPETPAILIEAPNSLVANEFLTTNPGIQGSNLFLRFSVLLSAGGFDEALRSTTDRDLCIRVADLGVVRYQRVGQALVDHYAENTRDRLSTPGSLAKREGLAAFWQKYHGRMDNAERDAFAERCDSIFDAPMQDGPPARVPARVPRRGDAAVVVGLIARNARPESTLAWIESLVEVAHEGHVSIDVVLLEEGAPAGHTSVVELAARVLRDSGAGCFPISREAQREHWRHERASSTGADTTEPDSIGDEESGRASATRLRVYCAQLAAARAGSRVWLATCETGVSESATAERFDHALQRLGAILLDDEVLRGSLDALHADGLSAINECIARERVHTAKHRVHRHFSLTTTEVLGQGSEAVVLTDGKRVYKCIDYWKTRMPDFKLAFIRAEVGRWTDLPGLYEIEELVEDGPWAILTYRYEDSEPYRGGHERGLVDLLESCTEAGIVCNNVHPKNLVVAAGEVKLIDYGSDIVPWTALGFEHMARRAYLSITEADHAELKRLMREALTDVSLPELEGFSRFRSQLPDAFEEAVRLRNSAAVVHDAPPHSPFALFVGVISSEAPMLWAFLSSITLLQRCPSVGRLGVVLLDNGCQPELLDEVLEDARSGGLRVALVGAQGTHHGALDSPARQTRRQVGIAEARTMLQRHLGTLMQTEPGAIGWVLDDDMRVDDRALRYLHWLPAFREQGVDVLLGSYEGSSPNPPLNGLRVQLVDLFHNLACLKSLSDEAPLPERMAENAEQRARYSDYYYDLSRKHSGHLEMPHWLEPVVKNETVREARARLAADALGILNGQPLTRSLVCRVPENPIAAARPSVNRGGCTFILNPLALTMTPNTISRVRGSEARRSDMIWAIVNRHYRKMTIKAVGFPVHHLGRIHSAPTFDLAKIQGEIVGSAIYAALGTFLAEHVDHALDFTPDESKRIGKLAAIQLGRRLKRLEQSFYRIAGLRESIRAVAAPGELDELLRYLDDWFTQENFERIRAGVESHSAEDLGGLLNSFRSTADALADTATDVEPIVRQLAAHRAGAHLG